MSFSECLKILVVDDEDLIRTLCQRVLQAAGYEVITAADGEEALAKMETETFDAVLIDYQLPGRNGVEVFREIHAAYPEPPGILLTGYGTFEVLVEALKAGFRGFLAKPVRREQLVAEVQRVLEKKQMEQELARLHAYADLYQTMRNILVIDDLRELAEFVLHIGVRKSGADSGSLLLRENEKHLRLMAVQGLPPEAAVGTCSLVQGTIAGHVLATGEPLILRGGPQDNPEFAAKMRRGNITASLSLPLTVRDRVIGVLNLNKHHTPATFTEADAELLSVLTAHAALAFERLRIAQEQREAERLATVGQMASTIMHDLRNPIAAIRMIAEEIAAEYPDTAEYVQMIIEATDRTVGLAEDLLAYTRGETGLKFQEQEVQEFLVGVVRGVRHQLEASGITLEEDYGDVGRAEIDGRRLERVLFNLINNAREAMPQGGTLRLSARREDDTIVLQIADTGTGIPPEVREHIFEPFFTHGKRRGTGLGLAVVDTIVRAHNGTIEVESEEGKGTTFTLRLPVRQPGEAELTIEIPPVPEEQVVPPPETPPVSAAPEAERLPETAPVPRILVIDDEEMVRNVLALYLQREGYAVETAASGQEGLRALATQDGDFALILLDLHLPDMQGDAVLEQVRREHPETKVVIVTGMVDEESTERLLAAGAVACLHKPVRQEEVRTLLKEILSPSGFFSIPKRPNSKPI